MSTESIDIAITVLTVIIGIQIGLTGASWVVEVKRKGKKISSIRWGWPVALTVSLMFAVWQLIQLAVLAAVGTIEVSPAVKAQFITISLAAPAFITLMSGAILIFQLTRKK